MSNEETRLVEELIRSAKITPPNLKPLRRRVVRSARKAARQRVVRRRVWCSLAASAVAILLAHIVNLSITPEPGPNQNAFARQREAPAYSTGRGAAEWSDVELFNRERAKQSGIIRGEF